MTENERYNAGRLQWGHEIKAITKEAEAKLAKMKEEHPDWDFPDLAKKVREKKLKPYIY